jgi:hypothetical protein
MADSAASELTVAISLQQLAAQAEAARWAWYQLRQISLRGS